MSDHAERKHSKFSASGSERWFNCQGSVALSEGLPDKDSIWSIEGTKAHELLEALMLEAIKNETFFIAEGLRAVPKGFTKEMLKHGERAANFIFGHYKKAPESELLVETRIQLGFIHPEMFGTFDGAVVDYFGTLHVYDYKYGAGHSVSPGSLKKPNLQMIFYGIGLAYRYGWNFKRIRLWIIQPRIKSYHGPVYLEMPIEELRKWVPVFTKAVEKVEKNPNRFVEGTWCHWCKAKGKCPLKQEKRIDRNRAAFLASPL